MFDGDEGLLLKMVSLVCIDFVLGLRSRAKNSRLFDD